MKLSLRPEQRAGSDEVWDKAEQGLRDALTACGVEWGRTAWRRCSYGPKIEYHVKDALVALGSAVPCSWTSLPERLNAEYVTKTTTVRVLWLFIRAILVHWSAIGILIENHAGSFPCGLLRFKW